MQSRTFEMTTRPSRLRLPIAGLAALAMLLAGPPVRAAFLPLPASGAQVNDDPANSIDASQDAGVSDVAGGTVRPGNIPVPWATFEQKVAAGAQQIFVRAFKSGAWVTQGSPASLNIDPTEEAEAPSVDFAGTGRTVPWVAWYEPSAAVRLADEHLRQPLQRGGQRLAALRPGPRPAPPAVSQHPHRSHGRESLGRGRCRRRRQRSGSLDHLGGERRRPG